MFKALFSHGKKERRTLENLRKHVKLLSSACDVLRRALETEDRGLAVTVIDMEREGDAIRREIMANIHEGAFLPYLRPNLYRFAEIIDEVFDLVEDAARYYEDLELHETLREDCRRIAVLSSEMSEMLCLTFETMLEGGDLREKTLALRIYEKKVDDIKFELLRKLKGVQVKDFWEGKTLSDFVDSLVRVSDVIEDASDALDIIHVSMG